MSLQVLGFHLEEELATGFCAKPSAVASFSFCNPSGTQLKACVGQGSVGAGAVFVTELGAAVVEEDPHGVCGIVGIVFLKHETKAIDQLDAVTGQGFCGCGRSGCGHDEEVLKSARDSVREDRMPSLG
jgi:hypothetical protein